MRGERMRGSEHKGITGCVSPAPPCRSALGGAPPGEQTDDWLRDPGLSLQDNETPGDDFLVLDVATGIATSLVTGRDRIR